MKFLLCALAVVCSQIGWGQAALAQGTGADAAAAAASANEALPLQPPKWVEMAPYAGDDARLSGLSAPRGVRVEVVAEHASLTGLMECAFADDGMLHALVWDGEAEHAKDRLVLLRDANEDGKFDDVEILMDDLQRPVGLLVDGGWTYFQLLGRLVRRRPHDAERLTQLQQRAKDKTGPPTSVTSDRRWIEQELVRGLSFSKSEPAAGVALGPDGCLYLAMAGNTATCAIGWDGTSAAVLSSGCVLRMELDGSRLREFARGLACPAGPVFDGGGNVLLLDHFRAAADQPAVARLLHLEDSADYGWRRGAGGGGALACEGQTDEARKGTLPSVARFAGSAPSSAQLSSSLAFPEEFFGLIMFADPASRSVRACEIERTKGPFGVKSSFALLESPADGLTPQAIIQAPDGAIYVTTRKGIILRLTWSGTEKQPAIEAGSLQAWKKLSDANEEALWNAFDSSDLELRSRAAREIVRRSAADDKFRTAARRALLDRAADLSLKAGPRASAIRTAVQLADAAVYEALAEQFRDDRAEVRAAAFEAIGNHPPSDPERVVALAEAVQGAWSGSDETPAERPMRLALARLAAKGAAASAEWGFEAASVSHLAGISRQSFDAHVRAVEIVPGAASDLMIGNLEVALFLPEAEPQERQRLKEFVTLTAESMRTRELAAFLDSLLRHEQDIFAKLDAQLEERLIRSYRNIEVDPPIRCDALLQWIEKHPGGPAEVDVAALETAVAVGVSKPEAAAKLAERLLQTPDEKLRLRVIQSIGLAKMKGLGKSLSTMLGDKQRSDAERAALAAALKQLQ